jgi:hypothetical protein
MKTLIFFLASSCHIVLAGNQIHQSVSGDPDQISVGHIHNNPEDSVNTEWTPDLYWGVSPSGNQAERFHTSFYVKYASDIPVNELFTIRSLELNVNGRVAYISGSRLTDDLHKMIYELPSGTTIYCYARYTDEKGIMRIIEGEWELK